MTEPGAGSDVRSMTTRARRDGGDWVINGAKHFISYADMADFVVLFAVTGTEQGPRGERSAISAFLVDHGTPGFTVSRGTSSVSHRGYHHCELAFADCRVPGSALLGDEGHGFDLLSEWLGASRLTGAASSVGRARSGGTSSRAGGPGGGVRERAPVGAGASGGVGETTPARPPGTAIAAPTGRAL